MAESKFSAVLKDAKRTPTDTVANENPRPKKQGRPKGKRSNPDYEQVTAYIPSALYDQVKIELIQHGRKEFSTLLEELLTQWVQSKRK